MNNTLWIERGKTETSFTAPTQLKFVLQKTFDLSNAQRGLKNLNEIGSAGQPSVSLPLAPP